MHRNEERWIDDVMYFWVQSLGDIVNCNFNIKDIVNPYTHTEEDIRKSLLLWFRGLSKNYMNSCFWWVIFFYSKVDVSCFCVDARIFIWN